MKEKLLKIGCISVVTFIVTYIITYGGYVFSDRFAFKIYTKDHPDLLDNSIYYKDSNGISSSGYRWFQLHKYDPKYPEILQYMIYGVLLYILFIVVLILITICLFQIKRYLDKQ